MGSVADIVASTSLIQLLRTSLIGSRIAFVGEESTVTLLEHNPRIDTIMAIPERSFPALGGIAFGWRMKRMRFDIALDLSGTSRSSRLVERTGAQLRMVREPAEDWSVFLKRLSNQLGLDTTDAEPEVFLTETEKREARIYLQWLDYETRPLDASKPLVAIQPGEISHPPLDAGHITDFIDMIAAKVGAEIVLLPSSGNSSSVLVQDSFANVKVLPRLHIRQAAAILSHCSACVSGDSDVTALAAGVGIPTVAPSADGKWKVSAPEGDPGARKSERALEVLHIMQKVAGLPHE